MTTVTRSSTTSKVEHWAHEIGVEVVAGTVFFILGLAATTIYGWLSRDLELSLIVGLLVLALSNFLVALWLWRLFRKQQEVMVEFSSEFHQQGQQLQELHSLLEESPYFGASRTKIDPASRLTRLFEISDKYFDEERQDIVFEFTNKTDSPFYIRKVVYADKTFGIPVDAIEHSRKLPDTRGVVVPIDNSNVDIPPEGVFQLRLHLRQSWSPKDVNAKFGDMGYLRIFADHKDFVNARLPYSF